MQTLGRHELAGILNGVSFPISAPVADFLASLASLITQKDLEALYKTAISQAHDPIGSKQLGSLPVVSRFMKDVLLA